MLKYFKHYKGGFYRELHRKGRDCENAELIVTYKALQDKGEFKKGQIWHRKELDFDAVVMIMVGERDFRYKDNRVGYGGKRFRKLKWREILLLWFNRRSEID